MDTKSSAISENITKDLFKRTLEDLILSKEAEGKKIKSTSENCRKIQVRYSFNNKF